MFTALKQDLPELFTGKQLTNVKLVTAFLRSPKSFQMEFSSHNMLFLNRANVFQSVILSISSSSEIASESLMDFTVNVTVPENRLTHIRFIFDVLMVGHLAFAASPDKPSCVSLLQLLHRFLPAESIPIELMLPALLTSLPDQQIWLIRIFLDFLSPSFHPSLTILLREIQSNPVLDSGLFDMALLIPNDRISFILFYAVTHREATHLIETLPAQVIPIIANALVIPPFVFDQILLSLASTEAFLPVDITEQSIESSPLCQVMHMFVTRALVLGGFEAVEQFITSIIAIDTLFAFPLVSALLFFLYSINQTPGVPEVFVIFCLDIACYALGQVKAEQSDTFSLIAYHFISSVVRQISDDSSSDLVNHVLDVLVVFAASTRDNEHTFTIISHSPILVHHRRASDLIIQLGNPMGDSQVKSAKVSSNSGV
jgi:hypothetical protein